MANSNFWYPRHFKDYAAKTAHLSLAEHGAYALLLDHYYQSRGKLMANALAIARVCRCQSDDERNAVQSVLDQFFTLGADGMYYNERADAELGLTEKVVAKRSAAGKAGAAARWRMANAMANASTAQSDSNAIMMANGMATQWQNDAQPQPQPQVKKEPPYPAKAGQAAKRQTSAIALQTFLDQCKAANSKPIPEGDPVFEYAEKAGIPQSFLKLQWLEFRERYSLPGAKRYKAWPTVFGKSVRGNWFKLWYAANEGGYQLTTVGQQAQRNHGGAS